MSASNYLVVKPSNGNGAQRMLSPLVADETLHQDSAVLELADGTLFRGTSFGAPGKSISGECVFQTGAAC